VDALINISLFGLFLSLTFFFNLTELALVAVRPPEGDLRIRQWSGSGR
jgi:hypothetical protein